MQVELKHAGFEIENDPFSLSRTITVLWEIEDELPWTDHQGEFSKVIHKVKPVTLQKRYTTIYERIPDGTNNTH